MRAMSKIMLAALLIVLVSGCCVKFEDVAPGTQYPVGQTFYTSGTNITVEQFQWANTTWTTNGKARIDATNHARGTGREINANNVNLRFKFDYPLKKITLKFAELGGNNNMMVNGSIERLHAFQIPPIAAIGRHSSHNQGMTGFVSDFLFFGR